MTDDDRNARIETLTDAIADTNRAVADTNRAVADTNRAVADTNRAVAGLVAHGAGVDRQLNRVIHGLESLTEVVHLHLRHDHGYIDPTDEP